MARTFLSSLLGRSGPARSLLPPILPPFLLVLLLHVTSSQNSYSISGEVFNGDPQGTLAAFWDINQDRLTDVIVWTDTEPKSKVRIYLSETGLDKKHPVLRLSESLDLEVNASRAIVGVIPGDFNGDLILDFVIVTVDAAAKANPTGNYRLDYAMGGMAGIVEHERKWYLSPLKAIPHEGDVFDSQPTVLDYDGNTVPDLLVQKDGKMERLFVKDTGVPGTPVWEMAEWDLKWDPKIASLDSPALHSPHSNAFIDVNEDLIADLCLTMKDKNDKKFLVVAAHKEFAENALPSETPFAPAVAIPFNETFFPSGFTLGQVVYADFNDDHKVDAIIPIQLADGTSRIIMYEFPADSQPFTDISPEWGDDKLISATGEFPLRIHLGDYDQDGFVDALAIVKHGESKQVVLLQNVPVNSDPTSTDKSRKFALTEETKKLTKDIVDDKLELAVFFDAYDDGFLDILVVDSDGKIKAYINNLGIDATWIKAMVYTGFCGSLSEPAFPRCPEKGSDKSPISLPVVGASIKMDTTRGDGKLQSVAAGLLSQLTHFALQMPTTMFGLGRSPNFVEYLTVGLAPVLNHTSGSVHVKRFEQTIPNSAVVIDPNPLNQPENWRAYIYVTPSSAMLETGIVLSVVFALLAILVGLLHLKEKREDQKEKLVEMQRFHFDAM